MEWNKGFSTPLCSNAILTSPIKWPIGEFFKTVAAVRFALEI